jgi:XTP/dITP diphosphohydrolase
VAPVARLCSHNRDKLRELRAALPGWEVDLLGAGELPPEEGESYYENALAKARFGRENGESDAWMIGEDSGIEVGGLGGGPGVRSARFGGSDPVGRLLLELQGADGDGRRARYVCELVALSPAEDELRGTGVLEGRIGQEPRGSEGFGYDPIFVPDGEERTVAELGNEWKRTNSHRARAAASLAAAVKRARALPRP